MWWKILSLNSLTSLKRGKEKLRALNMDKTEFLGCNSNERIMYDSSYANSNLRLLHFPAIPQLHSIALPHGKCSSHIHHSMQYLAYFHKQNKAANHIHIPKMFQFAITLMKDLHLMKDHLLNMPRPFNQHPTSNALQK